jgi:hypothetical protein
MSRMVSKKQMILDYIAQHPFARAGVTELRLIQNHLRSLGRPSSPPSLSYIVNVLRQSGIEVAYEDPYTESVIPQRYAAQLEGTLRFNDLPATEHSLRKLDEAYREYQAHADVMGQRLVRTIVFRGKRRAESLAARPRLNAAKRQEKQEIANWFRVWLESPGLFFDWLAVRKETEDFHRQFASGSAAAQDEAETATDRS